MVDVSDFSKVADIGKTTTKLTPAITKLKDAKLLVDSIAGVMKSVETIIAPFLQKFQQGQDSNILPAPPQQPSEPIAPAAGTPPAAPASSPPAAGSNPAATHPKDKPPAIDLAFFQSDEGMKAIIGAIDNFQPLVGDIKLSEVKQALQEVIKESENKKEVKTK